MFMLHYHAKYWLQRTCLKWPIFVSTVVQTLAQSSWKYLRKMSFVSK